MVTAQMIEIYETGVLFSAIASVIIVSSITMFRLIRLFIDFSSGQQIDTFEESCIFEWSTYELGNNLFGILADLVMFAVIAFMGTLIWPIFWPAALLTIVAFRMRKRNIEAQKVIDKLKS